MSRCEAAAVELLEDRRLLSATGAEESDAATEETAEAFADESGQDYGYEDYGYEDYGYEDYGYEDYGYEDYGYEDYGYEEWMYEEEFYGVEYVGPESEESDYASEDSYSDNSYPEDYYVGEDNYGNDDYGEVSAVLTPAQIELEAAVAAADTRFRQAAETASSHYDSAMHDAGREWIDSVFEAGERHSNAVRAAAEEWSSTAEAADEAFVRSVGAAREMRFSRESAAWEDYDAAVVAAGSERDAAFDRAGEAFNSLLNPAYQALEEALAQADRAYNDAVDAAYASVNWSDDEPESYSESWEVAGRLIEAAEADRLAAHVAAQSEWGNSSGKGWAKYNEDVAVAEAEYNLKELAANRQLSDAMEEADHIYRQSYAEVLAKRAVDIWKADRQHEASVGRADRRFAESVDAANLRSVEAQVTAAREADAALLAAGMVWLEEWMFAHEEQSAGSGTANFVFAPDPADPLSSQLADGFSYGATTANGGILLYPNGRQVVIPPGGRLPDVAPEGTEFHEHGTPVDVPPALEDHLPSAAPVGPKPPPPWNPDQLEVLDKHGDTAKRRFYFRLLFRLAKQISDGEPGVNWRGSATKSPGGGGGPCYWFEHMFGEKLEEYWRTKAEEALAEGGLMNPAEPQIRIKAQGLQDAFEESIGVSITTLEFDSGPNAGGSDHHIMVQVTVYDLKTKTVEGIFYLDAGEYVEGFDNIGGPDNVVTMEQLLDAIRNKSLISPFPSIKSYLGKLGGGDQYPDYFD